MSNKIRGGEKGPAKHVRRYLDAVLASDQAAAARAITRAEAEGWSLGRLYVELLGPAQVAIGERWHAGRISVAQEHAATEITLREMERLRQMVRPGDGTAPRALVAAVEDDAHALGARMAADLLGLDGWAVDYLGASTPTGDLVAFARRRRPALVALSVTRTDSLPMAVDAVRRLRQLAPAPALLVGGRAVHARSEAARRLAGAIVAGDVVEGVRAARRMLEGPVTTPAPDVYLSGLGRRIQEARTARGWTQQQLAETASIDRAYISGLEHGKQNPTVGALLRLAAALELPLEHLVTTRPEKRPSSAPPA
jgi:methanogenic corrinoid protein MtbC1/DNA-binding XRE family transcriptional regulator